MYLIWGFEFSSVDPNGKIPMDISNYNKVRLLHLVLVVYSHHLFQFGLDMYPDHHHFKYKVQPRNARKADLIRTTFTRLDAEL